MVSYSYLKTTVVGDAGVGKTLFCRHFINGELINPTHYVPTIGVEFSSKWDASSNHQVWDTPGHGRFHWIVKSYLRGPQAVILMFDVTNEASFHRVEEWCLEVKSMSQPDSVVMVLVGNKTDLTLLRAISFERAKRFADSHGLTYVETSALDLEHVEAVFSHNIKEYQLLKQGQKKRNKLWTSPEYEEVSIVILGEPHVGKTSIWRRYMEDAFSCWYNSTTVMNHRRRLKVFCLNGKRIKLDLCDSASGIGRPLQYSMASMCTSIVVFDVNDYETFVQSHNIITWALKKTKSLLLVGNKCEGCFADGQPDRMVTQEEAQHLADSHGIPYVEVSAKEGTNVEYAVTMAVAMALNTPGLKQMKHFLEQEPASGLPPKSA